MNNTNECLLGIPITTLYDRVCMSSVCNLCLVGCRYHAHGLWHARCLWQSGVGSPDDSLGPPHCPDPDVKCNHPFSDLTPPLSVGPLAPWAHFWEDNCLIRGKCTYLCHTEWWALRPPLCRPSRPCHGSPASLSLLRASSSI